MLMQHIKRDGSLKATRKFTTVNCNDVTELTHLDMLGFAPRNLNVLLKAQEGKSITLNPGGNIAITEAIDVPTDAYLNLMRRSPDSAWNVLNAANGTGDASSGDLINIIADNLFDDMVYRADTSQTLVGALVDVFTEDDGINIDASTNVQAFSDPNLKFCLDGSSFSDTTGNVPDEDILHSGAVIADQVGGPFNGKSIDISNVSAATGLGIVDILGKLKAWTADDPQERFCFRFIVTLDTARSGDKLLFYFGDKDSSSTGWGPGVSLYGNTDYLCYGNGTDTKTLPAAQQVANYDGSPVEVIFEFYNESPTGDGRLRMNSYFNGVGASAMWWTDPGLDAFNASTRSDLALFANFVTGDYKLGGLIHYVSITTGSIRDLSMQPYAVYDIAPDGATLHNIEPTESTPGTPDNMVMISADAADVDVPESIEILAHIETPGTQGDDWQIFVEEAASVWVPITLEAIQDYGNSISMYRGLTELTDAGNSRRYKVETYNNVEFKLHKILINWR